LNEAFDAERPIPESYWVISGRLLAGEYPALGILSDQTRRTQLDAFLQAGFDTFIDFTDLDETLPYEPLLREEASLYSLQVEHLRFSVGDYGLPSLEGMRATLDAIDDALARGRKVYLHCYGGIGRTGTTVGCYLARHGRTGEQALAQLAEWWQTVPKHIFHPNSPETLAQKAFILNWPEQPN
jgi:predicted protein tyrosine phosphatase